MTRYFLLLCLFVPSVALSEVYKYVTEDGNSHYVTDPQDVPAQYRDQVDAPHKLPTIMKSDFKLAEMNSESATNSKDVEIYVTSWCGACKAAEKFLKANKVKFKRFDIEKSSTGKKKHQQAGGGGVPIIKVGDTYLKGFSEPQLRQALGL